ncbi:BZ3500_MvSof-1268-A1-R1_Chr1-3g02290 [Microbotryum saponariae]|uniref:BZ3500_MvSof-1268-A1-R1_Chr1-3g02290 protein n=1 Tax=Microbotryum saponariae TaxID=289078 RepID=A0A2X0KEJ5_9BASI|nr:BZ3500_MvSof-1268-A1-R1_Chr1-3g02290 [Microbotryum saponariae]SCZ95890.1 BZ3501_MvSof-1269-A2-R1_Chr1-3g01893 [Microbotryum saponariae]
MSDATVTNVAWAEKPSKPLDQYNNYLCILPDFIEGSKRLSVRASHLEHAAEGHKNGWISKSSS